MARSASLRTTTVKGVVYWSTQTGGGRTYFGRKSEVSRKEAEAIFADHLKTIRTETNRQRDQRVSKAVTVWEVCDRRTLWVQANLSKKSYAQYKWALTAFCNYTIKGTLYGKGQTVGDLPCDRVTLQHAQEFVSSYDDPGSKRHLVICIKACFTWAAQTTDADGGGLMPKTCQPFRYLKRPHVPIKDLTEADLITDVEHHLLVTYSADRHHEWHGTDNTVQDIIKLMHHCGPRTSEPLEANVRDFNRRTRQLTLGNHKRSQTQQNTALRQLTLNDEAFAIVAKHCADKGPNDPIFTTSTGSRWSVNRINLRFRQIKALVAKPHAKDKRVGTVRASITPYSYRDLYISELLMVGVPVFQVAKMAGTSIKMIEKHYGHFFNSDLTEAQGKLDAVRKSRSRKAKGLRVVA
jgi:integrase